MKMVETTDGMKWMLDSGCMNHTTGSRKAFVEESYVGFPADQGNMKIGSRELISVVGIVSVKTHIWTPERGGKNPVID